MCNADVRLVRQDVEGEVKRLDGALDESWVALKSVGEWDAEDLMGGEKEKKGVGWEGFL